MGSYHHLMNHSASSSPGITFTWESESAWSRSPSVPLMSCSTSHLSSDSLFMSPQWSGWAELLISRGTLEILQLADNAVNMTTQAM